MRARVLFLFLSALSFAQTPSTFPALQQWRDAVIKGDPAGLKSLYSLSPPVQVSTREGKVDTDADVAFWTGLKARDMSIKVAEAGSPQPGVEVFTLQVKVDGASGRTTRSSRRPRAIRRTTSPSTSMSAGAFRSTRRFAPRTARG